MLFSLPFFSSPVRFAWSMVLASFLLVVAVSAFFYFFPHVDLAVAAYYAPPDETRNPFPLRVNEQLQGWRDILAALPKLVAGMLIFGALTPLFFPAKSPRVSPRFALLYALTLLLGAGLVVNVVLKDNWGRPRPVHLVEFGGNKTFQKPWVISSQCATNCSFVSGEAAGSAVLLLLGFFARRWGVVFLASGMVVIATTWLRVAFGGHFLSDVVLGVLLTLHVAAWLFLIIYGVFNTRFSDFTATHALQNKGQAIRNWLKR